MGQQTFNQTGILINTTHTHQFVIVQHALKSHTDRQLPATCCECVIVTLGVPFHISVSSQRYVPPRVCVECNGMHTCAAPTTKNYLLFSTPPWRISCHTCWRPHHSQSRIHGKFNLSDTLGWFVPWHRALSCLVNCVSHWKSKQRPSFTMGPEQSKTWACEVERWWENIVNVWVFLVHRVAKQLQRLICYTLPCGMG